jgi:hypothetical protein
LNDKSLIERFDRALKAFSATRTATERTAASLEMRLLDGLKSYLWKQPGAMMKNMKWELMWVSKNTPGQIVAGFGPREYQLMIPIPLGLEPISEVQKGLRQIGRFRRH